ncbi:MAG TPA: hypothetical protein VMJ73_11105 [Rhizomicrobium sp.]|nr:hypothetical protein [Rhizomicrobium sp.]
MNLDEHDDIPSSEHWDKGVILVAALLTLCGIAVCFFSFTIPSAKPAKPAQAIEQPGEVMIGVGQGSSIHPGAGQGSRP